MDEQPKRTTLTPLGDELTPREIVPGKATLLERWQRRRARSMVPWRGRPSASCRR